MFPALPPDKPQRSMRDRINRILARGPVKGQVDLGNEVLGKQWTLDQWREFTDTLRSMLVEPKEVNETRTQLPGTGHEGPPVYEWTYSEIKKPKVIKTND